MSNENLTLNEAFELAVKNHQKNNIKDAQIYYRKVLELDPNYINALNNIGVIFQGLGKKQRAKECFEKAIKINPNYADAYYNLGNIFKDLGKNQKAKEFFEKAIEINPNYAEAYYNIGIIFKRLGKIEKAKECYKKAIELNPNYADAHYNLGNIFQEVGDLQKAKEFFEKAIEINPNVVMAYNNLGIIFKELGKIEKAKECFEKSIKIDFFINTRSMMEMNKEIIKKYFNLIESHISVNGFFLNINRYEKSTVGEKILLHEYPYDNNWDVIISKPSYLQAGIHFLLTQRKFENLARNIGDELNKIKIIYMNFPKKKYLILMSLKSNIIKTIYKIIKIFLLFTLKKKKIKKIAKILNGMI